MKTKLGLAWLAAVTTFGLAGGHVAFAQPTPLEDQPTPVEVAPSAGSGATTPPSQGKAEGKGTGSDESPPQVDDSKSINWTDIHYGQKDYYGGPLGDKKMEMVDVDGKPHVEEGEEEKMSPPFIFMLINFALLLFILAKYLAPAGKKLAEERHDLIKNALAEAAELRTKAEQKLKEYEQKLGKVDAEIKALVDGLRADAESDKQRILAAAEAQAAQLKRDAESRIAAEIETARLRLTREVTIAAAAATEKLLREKTTADDQNKLVSSFISGVQS